MRTSRRSWLTLTWLAAAGVVSPLGCKRTDVEPAEKYGGPSTPEPSASAAPHPPDEAPLGTWYEVARDARLFNREALDELRAQVQAESASGAPELERTLDAMAAVAPTPEGLRTASRLAHDAIPHEDRAVKGSPRRAGLLCAAGIAVLQGIIARACAHARQQGTLASVSLDLMQAVRQMPLPRRYTSAGQTDGLGDRQQLSSELLTHLDDDMAAPTLRAAEKWPPVPNPR